MSLISELRRRNVFRVAATYVVVAWLIIQVVSTVSPPLNLPAWFETAVIVLLAIGFPIALVLAWAFELSNEGIRLTQEQDASGIAGGSRLDYVLITALAVVTVSTLWSQMHSREVDGLPGGPPATTNPSIAVLPFVDMSPGGDQGYFADGMAEELLNVLSRLDGLQVAGRTSSFVYKERDEDLRSIGRALNVATILEGSVRKDGNRIRVTAQLINAADGYHLWSDTFDRELTDIFSIQEEIATAVAGALGVRLGVGGVNAFRGAGTRNVEAYEAYLKGWSLHSADRESFRLLEKATLLDPNYAVAWAELGIQTASTQWRSNPEDAPAIMERAHEYAKKAVRLDPASAQSASLLGTILYARFDWIGGDEAHARALALLADRSTYSQHGNMLMRAGRLRAAESQFVAAEAVEPLGGRTTLFSWYVSLARGRPAEARRQLGG